MSEPLSFNLALHNDRLKTSILVSETGDSHKVFPLPRGQIDWKILPGKFVELKGGRKLAIVTVEMPEWLAKDRGLI